MSRIAEQSQRDATTGLYTNPSDRRVIERNAQPGLWRNLQRAAHKVPNDVGMAHDQRIRVFLLLRIGPVKVLAESGLDASAVLEELLQEIEKKCV